MEPLKFRVEEFRGTLSELLEQGDLEIENSVENFLQAHRWIRDQLTERHNILPIRVFADYRSRGRLHPLGNNGLCLMPVDNEPLASLYQHWINFGQISHSLRTALAEGVVVASWRCDEQPPSIRSMRFKGAKTQFRDRGLNLADINDAA